MLKSIALFLGLVLAVWAGPSDPEPRPDENWMRRHDGFVNNTLANPQIPILFYGDSITDGWAGNGRPIFDELYAPRGVTNYGIGGDQVQHLLWRAINGEVQGLSPKLVVLKIGTNNLGGANDTEIARGIETLVNKYRELIPTAKVLVLGILPRNGEGNYNRIVNINDMVARLHNGNTIFFLDMFASFSESWGVVPTALFTDGLHLTRAGYQEWADTMGPLFNVLAA